MDHLTERKDYYQRLALVESETPPRRIRARRRL
jgi:hypothetical protein